MPGRLITPQQARLYMEHRVDLGQAGAAAKAGISERSARRIDQRNGSPAPRPKRHWRTRHDPFEGVWESVIVPLLERENGDLQGKTIIGHLQQLYSSEKFPDKLLRTLQRRLAEWKLRHGPVPELIFPQSEEPGRIGYSDFTHASCLSVTIAGQPFAHLLYHFRLGYSGWSYATVVIGGESFAALAEGLTAAVTCLGGTPRVHRTDSLSAAFRNLDKEAVSDQTLAYEQLCTDLQMKATRNNPGVSHENGSIESPHGHLKKDLDQALRIRGSRDFPSVEAYRRWLENQMTERRRRLNPERMEAERASLQSLPAHLPSPATMSRERTVTVSSGATITVNKVLYTVTDRLKGRKIRVHIFDDRLECYYRGEHVETLPRIHAQGNHRKRVINYHHIIEMLARKPGAFPRLVYRDDVHPGPVWKETWEALFAAMDERTAARQYLGILLLAHRAACESELTSILTELRSQNQLPDLEQLRHRFLTPSSGDTPPIVVLIPDACVYDQLLSAVWTQAS